MAKNNISNITMLSMVVTDMQKSKEFYTDKLGFGITTEYRQDDGHWWTGIKLPEDSMIITLSTFRGDGKPGMMNLYLLAENIEATYKDLAEKGTNPTPVTKDLYGPGSGVRWFSLKDPDGNNWTVAEAKASWM